MKGFVYRIYDNTNGNVYYGSTKETVSRRMTGHRTKYKLWLKGKVKHYTKSFDILKNGDYSYNIVEEVEYENKYELHNRERYYIENNECINKFIPNRTRKQWREDNKEKIKQYYVDNKNDILERHKQYLKENKDKISKQTKEYYENNKERYKEYQKDYRENNKDKNKEYQKDYREDNKDKIKQKDKEYRKNNKDKIKEYYENNKERMNEKVTCECGCIVSRNNLSQHKKTEKHLKLISTK